MTSVLSQVYRHTDSAFIRKLFAIALPITLQSILFSSRGLVDVLMLGQLGEADIAAVGVASRAMFVTTIMIVGITTGGALLTAQYWGAGDKQGVRQSTALTWLVSMAVAAITAVGFWLFPSQIMSLTTDSAQINQLGSDYIVITAAGMFNVACVAGMAVGLRAMHQPGLSTLFSAIGIGSNVVLNWVLIFGHLGFPEMGIKGAAWATLISGWIEVGCLFGYLHLRKHLLAFGLADLKAACDWQQFVRFIRLSLPTTLNFLAWAGGLFVYHAIMGQTGVAGLAALSVMTPVESISLAFLIGVSNASAVLVGNQLGANKFDAVYYQALGLVVINLLIGIVVSFILYLSQFWILEAFTALTDETRALANQFILVLCAGVVIRSVPMTLIVGVLRAGGDVNFCLYQDLVAQWLVGIPVAAVCAIYFGFSPEQVYMLFLLEEVIKWFGSVSRTKSKRWMNNLIET